MDIIGYDASKLTILVEDQNLAVSVFNFAIEQVLSASILIGLLEGAVFGSNSPSNALPGYHLLARLGA